MRAIVVLFLFISVSPISPVKESCVRYTHNTPLTGTFTGKYTPTVMGLSAQRNSREHLFPPTVHLHHLYAERQNTSPPTHSHLNIQRTQTYEMECFHCSFCIVFMYIATSKQKNQKCIFSFNPATFLTRIHDNLWFPLKNARFFFKIPETVGKITHLIPNSEIFPTEKWEPLIIFLILALAHFPSFLQPHQQKALKINIVQRELQWEIRSSRMCLGGGGAEKKC